MRSIGLGDLAELWPPAKPRTFWCPSENIPRLGIHFLSLVEWPWHINVSLLGKKLASTSVSRVPALGSHQSH